MNEIDAQYFAKEINILTSCKAKATGRKLSIIFPDGWQESTYSKTRALWLFRMACREGIR